MGRLDRLHRQECGGSGHSPGVLQFTKGFEKEADYLGLQYLYKAGYDPTSFVDFFEKVQSMEKKSPAAWKRSFPRTR